ncbi:Fe-S cluster assembly protein SufD [Vagococcus lutrae]|uniref:Fe-S cluster assembly protein SufD n=1 Tax=Vagococcus lutrae TaxID=81947 RepID=UPI00200D50A9|nr:Fe-S cluster assembly protein SufD [Vagococcus lutrae]MDT2811955.1 Fe-S cluster assembly protein SufD [Vagococcus lutrae]UQF12393.1 Fe-S cluster assembly protein SufD [Vagococcus lutrae]
MKDVTWTDYTAQIQDYSLSQGEPEWLLNRRIQALEKIETLALPMIERVKIHRWPLTEVTTMIDDTVSGAVYDFEQVENNPLIVQHSTQTLVEQMPAHLIEKGVILTDIQTAVQDHSDLVEKALMQQAVHYDEDRLTAFHMAFMNSGIFLYIPKNVAIEEPVEALFYQDSHANTNFVKHVLIVAEENSEVSYLERFQTVGEGTEKATANIVVEVIAKQGAKVKFAAIDQLGEHVTTYINRRANVGRDASVDWAIGIMNDGNVVADFDSDLVGEGSHSEVKAVAISAGRQTQGIDTRVTNSGRHSVGHILQHGVIRERGTLTFNGIGHILKGAVGADAQQESRVLMLSDQARGDANPILLIDENEVTAGHAASVGRVDPEEMYYLMSRGLEKTEAERLVIRGFLGSVLTAIPIKAVRDELAEVIERKLS